MSRDAICQTAWDAIGPSLTLTRERFLEACQSPAAICEAAYPPPIHIPSGTVYDLVSGELKTTPGLTIIRDYSPCVAWMAGVGRWNKEPVGEPNRLPVPEEVGGAFQERPYKLLCQLSRHISPDRLISQACDEISDNIHAEHHRCGAEININRVCRAIAYLTCQAPEDYREREKITTYEHAEQCLKDHHDYLVKASTQVYYHAPLSYFGCVVEPRRMFAAPLGSGGAGGGRPLIDKQEKPSAANGELSGAVPSLQTPVMVLGGARFLGAEEGGVLSVSLLPPIQKGRISVLGQVGVDASYTQLTTPSFSGPQLWELGLHGGAALGVQLFRKVHFLADVRMSAALGYEGHAKTSILHAAWTGGLSVILPTLFEALKPMIQLRYGADLFVGSPKDGEAVRSQTGRGMTAQVGASFF